MTTAGSGRRWWCRSARVRERLTAARTAGGAALGMTWVRAAGAGGHWISGPRCSLEADAPRVECKVHGVMVAAVPWARHDAGFTRSFEDTAAWLAVNTSKAAICQLGLA